MTGDPVWEAVLRLRARLVEMKRQELYRLVVEFEAAGGRGVDLAERIDALREELELDEEDVCDHPEHRQVMNDRMQIVCTDCGEELGR